MRCDYFGYSGWGSVVQSVKRPKIVISWLSIRSKWPYFSWYGCLETSLFEDTFLDIGVLIPHFLYTFFLKNGIFYTNHSLDFVFSAIRKYVFLTIYSKHFLIIYLLFITCCMRMRYFLQIEGIYSQCCRLGSPIS